MTARAGWAFSSPLAAAFRLFGHNYLSQDIRSAASRLGANVLVRHWRQKSRFRHPYKMILLAKGG